MAPHECAILAMSMLNFLRDRQRVVSIYSELATSSRALCGATLAPRRCLRAKSTVLNADAGWFDKKMTNDPFDAGRRLRCNLYRSDLVIAPGHSPEIDRIVSG